MVAAEQSPSRGSRALDRPSLAMLTAILSFAAAVIAASVVARLFPPAPERALNLATAVVTILFALIAYKVVIRYLGKRPRDDLRGNGAALGLTAVGFGIGAAILSTSVGIAALLDVYNIVGPGSTDELVKDLVGVAIVPAFLEEIFFRGILFRWIEEMGGSWMALLATSLAFGIAHIFNPNASALSAFAITVEAGLLLGAAYMLTRSLWMPMGLHAGWNFTQGFIWDVPVSGIDQNGLVEAQLSGPEILSGGKFGLEGSVIALLVATSVGIWMLLRAIRSGQLVHSPRSRRRLAHAVSVETARPE